MRLCLLVLSLLAGSAVPAFSNSAREIQTTPTYRDEGNAPELFNVACDSFTWATVVSSDTISRSVLFQWDASSLAGVCISTWTDGNCNSETKGVEISSATPSFTSYDQIRWNCRARPVNVAASRIKGYRARDRGDYGWIDRKD